MGSVLLVVPVSDSSVPKAALCAGSAALRAKEVYSGSALNALVIGPSAGAAAEALAVQGFEKVLFAEGETFEKYLASSYQEAILAAANELDASVIVSAATSSGKDVMPRVAAALGAGMVSDILAINDDGSVQRPMYAGDVIATAKVLTEKKVITARVSAFDPMSASGSAGASSALSVEATAVGEVEGYELSGGDRPELSDAEVVVSGGRALGSEEKFQEVIYPLADAFGAAVGASRAAVDSGYAPNDWQVGQTGKIVAPNLYVAAGISGAIQHLAGMKDSKVIVAINKDEEAPIFEIADYGLVLDLFEAVPELTEKVKALKS